MSGVVKQVPDVSVFLGRLAVDFDGKLRENTKWGAVDLAWNGFATVAYLNVVIDGRWAIRNAPNFGSDPPGTHAMSRYYVRLPVRRGRDSSRAILAYALTYAPVRSTLGLNSMEIILCMVLESYHSNIQRRLFPPLPTSPGLIIEGGHMGQVLACRRDVPNQECEPTECGPAAVSNGLLWINRKYRLGVDESKLSIDQMKEALRWQPGGVRNGQWADNKARYIGDKNLPFTSRKFPGGHVRQATEEFARGQAVEVFIGEHIATLICMGQDAAGNYWLNAASDTRQGVPGGAISQPISLTPNGTVITGPPWARPGDRVQNFVVQCPRKESE